jgi:hypothetical protein
VSRTWDGTKGNGGTMPNCCLMVIAPVALGVTVAVCAVVLARKRRAS